MQQANRSGSKLSKALLQMKFMKRTQERVEIEAANEERAALIFGQEITSEMREQGNRFVFEPSFCQVEDLAFGRMAFHNMNPEVEKMMASERLRADEREATTPKSSEDARDEQMAEHFGSPGSANGRKSGRKRRHQEAAESLPNIGSQHGAG